ncbi:Uncharacterised protein [Enterobacter cloacae]|uniref:Uncharacterized protein n=1 Tax=Enterobacter cloacae TaxID=550 RepID=A0A377M6Q9_ENTCL|nr:Uncharacterised protein [Enterobacter cloacae]
MSAAALTQIGASGEFEMIIATIDFDTQTSLQLFDVVIKRPAQAQQASVVCGR